MKPCARFCSSLKETRFVKFLLSVFEYLYIRWRVIRTVSTDIDQDDDSLASLSSDEFERRKIVRTNSVYPPSCMSSMRDPASLQKPGCIEIYNQFMNYGTMDETISGHIFLTRSASYYATSSTHLCQLSYSDSQSCSNLSSNWSNDVLRDSDIRTESCPDINSDNTSQYSYNERVRVLNKNQVRNKECRFLPPTPPLPVSFIEKSITFPGTNQEGILRYEQCCDFAMGGVTPETYPEKQRQIRNYFFTSPMYYEDGLRRTPIEAVPLDENSPENVHLRHLDEQRQFERINSEDLSNSELSNYQTASISSPIAKEISDRFSTKYWGVENHNGSGAIGAKDNYHNRYFGKCGYYISRNAIKDNSNGRYAYPAVERRALQKEKRIWTEINCLGGRYDDLEIGIPDTNGRFTRRWETEYEQQLPAHTSRSWKTPKKYTPKYSSLF